MSARRLAPGHRLQAIAEENNLAETAFFVAAGDEFQLRWFKSLAEVDLCARAPICRGSGDRFGALGTRSLLVGCEINGERAVLLGNTVTFMSAEIDVPV